MRALQRVGLRKLIAVEAKEPTMKFSQVSQSLSHLISAFVKAERWCDKQRREASSLPFRQAAARRLHELRSQRMTVRHVLQQSDRGQLDTYLEFAPIGQVDQAVSRLIRSSPESIGELDQLVFEFRHAIFDAVGTLQRSAENTLAVAIFDPIVMRLHGLWEPHRSGQRVPSA